MKIYRTPEGPFTTNPEGNDLFLEIRLNKEIDIRGPNGNLIAFFDCDEHNPPLVILADFPFEIVGAYKRERVYFAPKPRKTYRDLILERVQKKLPHRRIEIEAALPTTGKINHPIPGGINTPADALLAAFNWTLTPQGHTYWNRIHEELES